MASSIDFVVKNGLQVSTNIVVGTYTLNNTPISNGAIISGNVGIGTFNPTSQLHVYGNIKVSNTATSGGIIFPDGTFQNTSASGSTVNLNDDTTTNATRYLTFANATSGILTTLNTSSTKLTYNPLLATVNLTGGNLIVSNSTQVGNLSVTNTTTSTSTSTGALTVAGGIGVVGNIYVGGTLFGVANASVNASNIVVTNTSTNATFYPTFVEATSGNIGVRTGSSLTFNPNTNQLSLTGNTWIQNGGRFGNLSVTNTTAATSTTTGALTVAGGVGIAGNLYVGGNLVINGNVSYINSNITVIEDPTIAIGTGPNGANLTTTDNYDRGLEFHYYSGGGDRYGFIGWQNSSGQFIFVNNATAGSSTQIYTGPLGDSAFGNITISSASNTPKPSTSTTTGALIIQGTGGIGVGGNINAGGNIYTAQGFNSAGTATVNYLISNTGISSAVLNITGGLSASTITSNNWINGASITSSGTLSAAGQITGQSIVSNSSIQGSTLTGFTLNATDINATGVVSLTGTTSNTSTTSATTGALKVAGGIATQSNLWVSASTWLNNLSIISSNVSTSTSTGAVTIAGGLGIVGNVFAGRIATINSGEFGNVGINNTTISTSTTTGALIVAGGSGISGNLFVGSNVTVSNNLLVSSNTLFVNAVGNRVGIGTTVPAYSLEVNGSFAATTKSFVINHPTKPNKKLAYGSLESPYHGIRLTGKSSISNGTCTVELPEYIKKLVRKEGYQVQLTNIKHSKILYIDEISIDNNCFIVKFDQGLFDKFNKKQYEFFWSFTAIRNDIDELTVEY